MKTTYCERIFGGVEAVKRIWTIGIMETRLERGISCEEMDKKFALNADYCPWEEVESDPNLLSPHHLMKIGYRATGFSGIVLAKNAPFKTEHQIILFLTDDKALDEAVEAFQEEVRRSYRESVTKTHGSDHPAELEPLKNTRSARMIAARFHIRQSILDELSAVDISAL